MLQISTKLLLTPSEPAGITLITNSVDCIRKNGELSVGSLNKVVHHKANLGDKQTDPATNKDENS